MVIPSTNISESDLDADIRFDQLGKLLQTIAEAAFGIVRTRQRPVFCRVGGFQHLDRLESFTASIVKNSIDRVGVHRFEGVRDGTRAAPTHPEVIDTIHSHRGLAACKNTW